MEYVLAILEKFDPTKPSTDRPVKCVIGDGDGIIPALYVKNQEEADRCQQYYVEAYNKRAEKERLRIEQNKMNNKFILYSMDKYGRRGLGMSKAAIYDEIMADENETDFQEWERERIDMYATAERARREEETRAQLEIEEEERKGRDEEELTLQKKLTEINDGLSGGGVISVATKADAVMLRKAAADKRKQARKSAADGVRPLRKISASKLKLSRKAALDKMKMYLQTVFEAKLKG
jgi:hypothetical protein